MGDLKLKAADRGETRITEWDKDKEKIGLPNYNDGEKLQFIKNGNLSKLAITTIDPILFACLSYIQENIDKDEEANPKLAEEIIKILHYNEVDDPANTFWALRIWMERRNIFDKALDSIGFGKDVLPPEKMLKIRLRLKCTEDKNTHFKAPKPPPWDVTPEIYEEGLRTTIFCYTNLLSIKQYIHDENLSKDIDDVIKTTENWIMRRKDFFKKNPYFASLFLDYYITKYEPDTFSINKIAEITKEIDKKIFDNKNYFSFIILTILFMLPILAILLSFSIITVKNIDLNPIYGPLSVMLALPPFITELKKLINNIN